ncbi:MAG: helix-turn-helix domain-containing protein [Vicinamibacterales bacterium]
MRPPHRVRYNLKSLEIQALSVDLAMRIGALAQRTGTNVPTIRYYESIGLLAKAARHDGGHRLYTDSDVERLTFIRRCREYGFTVEQVRSLATLGRDHQRSCTELREVAATHLSGVEARIRELQGLARSLEQFVATCDATCAGGPGPACTILGDLGRSGTVIACATAPTRSRLEVSQRGPSHSTGDRRTRRRGSHNA